MTEQNRTVLTGTTIAVTAAGIGLCCLITKYRAPIFKQLRQIINYNDPLRNQEIQVINNVDECRTLMNKLKT